MTVIDELKSLEKGDKFTRQLHRKIIESELETDHKLIRRQSGDLSEKRKLLFITVNEVAEIVFNVKTATVLKTEKLGEIENA